MIFFGDVASPSIITSKYLEDFFKHNKKIFDDKRIVCNFEGLLVDRAPDDNNSPILYNHHSVLKTLDRGFSPVLCLANNHILDLPQNFKYTTDLLRTKGIYFVGAGKTKEEANAPIIVPADGTKVLLYNACWSLLHYDNPNPSVGVYVSEIDEENLLKSIKNYKSNNQGIIIVVFFHWNFDLETLPFPMYRQISTELVDAGVSLILGSHSHCFQGAEKYKDGLIVYGLGNFFIPHNQFVSGKLTYPDFSRLELALEWDPITKEAICHWFRYENTDNEHKLIHLESEKFDDSQRIKTFSPFKGMDEKQYLRYFRQNRRKKWLVPVYKDYRDKKINSLFNVILKLRGLIVRFLAKRNFIRWNR
jgi:poly-gamma-glutamate synthesis protein (capsule biosynthesis protein)